MKQQELAEGQFGSMAPRYLASPVHSRGADLDRLKRLAGSSRRVLDLGCGAGHASFALASGGATEVVAYDAAIPMLDVVAAEARVRGHTQIHTIPGHAEALPFSDASFDRVVTRYSAHHWWDAMKGFQEIHRVLEPGGSLIVIDVIAPETPLFDTVLQSVELLRDPSHVRDYRASEWCAMLSAARFSAAAGGHWKLPMEFGSWVARIGTPPARVAALEAVMDALPSQARDYFAISPNRSFSIDAGWFDATKL